MKAIYFDIDDTLIDKETHVLPVSAKQAIEQLAAAGHFIGIATGRARYFAETIIEQLPVQACVTINGQYVQHGDDVIYEQPIEKEDIEKVIAFCEKYGFTYGCIGNKDAKVSSKNNETTEVLLHWLDRHEEDPEYYQHETIYQMWVFIPEDHEANNHFPKDVDVRPVRFHSHAVDIVPNRGSKANGLQQLLSHLDISSDDLIVFGDGLNDLEMFALANTSVAMGNAEPQLKAIATYVTDPVLEDGIANALKKLALI